MDTTLMISTPAYGGMISLHTCVSLFEGMKYAESKGVNCKFIGKMNESLIQRARNDHASKALRENYTKLLFVDADVGFPKEWIYKLWQHNKSVVGGTYPMKALPIRFNINMFKEHHRFLFKPPYVQTEDLVKLKEELGEDGLIKVLHLPTGFLMIDRQALLAISRCVPQYQNNTYEFFPVKVNRKQDILESEDWGFCRLVHENLMDVYFDPELICDHVGTFVYSPNIN